MSQNSFSSSAATVAAAAKGTHEQAMAVMEMLMENIQNNPNISIEEKAAVATKGLTTMQTIAESKNTYENARELFSLVESFRALRDKILNKDDLLANKAMRFLATLTLADLIHNFGLSCTLVHKCCTGLDCPSLERDRLLLRSNSMLRAFMSTLSPTQADILEREIDLFWKAW